MVDVSSFYNGNYDRSLFLPIYEVSVGKGSSISNIKVQDMLNYKYIDLINNCAVREYYTWRDGDNLPNISHAYYGTTTAWWIIARKNGIINPLSLKVGDVIIIPDISSINSILSSTSNTSELDTEVTF